jgi:hypothetical protein
MPTWSKALKMQVVAVVESLKPAFLALRIPEGAQRL